ncbi:hypothetical protein OC834_007997, partial [Tilletia horrida]
CPLQQRSAVIQQLATADARGSDFAAAAAGQQQHALKAVGSPILVVFLGSSLVVGVLSTSSLNTQARADSASSRSKTRVERMLFRSRLGAPSLPAKRSMLWTQTNSTIGPNSLS